MERSIPFCKYLGITIVRLGHGRAEIKLNVTKSLTQSRGVAHGGIAATLVDSSIGFALYTLIKPAQKTTTVEMKVNYLAPATPGVLKAEGRIIRRGRRIAVGESEVRDENGLLIAKGLATYITLEDPEH